MYITYRRLREMSGVTGEFPKVLKEVPAVLTVVTEVLEEFPRCSGMLEVRRFSTNWKILNWKNHMHDCSAHTH